MSPDSAARSASAEQPFAAIVAGWLVVLATDAVVLATRMTTAPIGLRAAAHAFAAGQLLALGVVLACAAAAWRRLGQSPRVGLATLVVVSWGLGALLLREDVSGLADSLAKTTALKKQVLWLVLLVGVAASTWPIVWLGASLLARSRIWPLGVLLGVAIAAANAMDHDYPDIHLIVTPTYPGLHVLLAVLAATVAGVSIPAHSSLMKRLAAAPARPARLAQLGLAAIAVVAVAVWPANAVLLVLERHLGAVLLTYLGPLHSIPLERETVVAPDGPTHEWFVSRADSAPVAASTPRLLPADAIVLLVGIDSMRGELLDGDAYRGELPGLSRFRDQSVYFRAARAAGSSTAPSMSALFAGVSYSSLHWTRGDTNDSLVYPIDDETKRFPQVLEAGGVPSTHYDGTGFLLGKLGIVRGFSTEKSLRKGGFPKAGTLLTPIEEALRAHPEGPRFYFTHLLDAHSPYSGAGPRATPFEGYLAELGTVDKRLRKLFELVDGDETLRARTTIVLMSDHGEAFGEHGLQRHGVSLYDELLRVPLLIRVPGVGPRVIDDPVSLMDLGPTFLDLFGMDTPCHFMGQSLTGYLRGEQPVLGRPIVAEGRLERAMILPDGFKVIHDTRTHSVEVYDLHRDPGELSNVFDDRDPAMLARVRLLLAYFAAHTLRLPGYDVPYRKW